MVYSGSDPDLRTSAAEFVEVNVVVKLMGPPPTTPQGYVEFWRPYHFAVTFNNNTAHPSPPPPPPHRNPTRPPSKKKERKKKQRRKSRKKEKKKKKKVACFYLCVIDSLSRRFRFRSRRLVCWGDSSAVPFVCSNSV